MIVVEGGFARWSVLTLKVSCLTLLVTKRQDQRSQYHIRSVRKFLSTPKDTSNSAHTFDFKGAVVVVITGIADCSYLSLGR